MKDPLEGNGKDIDYHRYWKAMYEKEQEALANALEMNKSHQRLNGKLQERITELEQDNLELHTDNKKLALQIEDKVNQMRRSGM